MRILQISSASSFGGGERYVVDLSNSLAERGHDVYVALRPHSPLTRFLQLPSANIKTVPLRNALDAQSARALARIVKEKKIDIVHAHMARDYSLAAYASRSQPRPKFVVTRHVLFSLNGIHRRTLARANRVIAVSNAVARQLSSQRLVPDHKIALVPNGIDVDRFIHAGENFDRKALFRTWDVPEDCLLVGSIGELRKLKRHDDLIKAAKIVAGQVPDAHFVIAGVDTSPIGANRKELIELVKHLKLEDRVHFLGWLDDAEKLLCALDVFVSASETESFGLSIAEAMASGTAVVATRTEGAQEVVEDQVTGVLVDIGDVEGLANAIVELLKDSALRQSMCERSQASAQRRFTLSRMVDDIEKVYEGSWQWPDSEERLPTLDIKPSLTVGPTGTLESKISEEKK
jgi:glycosyltransferase involved in cell wall biosynthesis